MGYSGLSKERRGRRGLHTGMARPGAIGSEIRKTTDASDSSEAYLSFLVIVLLGQSPLGTYCT